MSKIEKVIVWLCTALTAACIVVATICFCIKVIVWSFELLKPLPLGLAIAGATVILAYKSRDSLK